MKYVFVFLGILVFYSSQCQVDTSSKSLIVGKTFYRISEFEIFRNYIEEEGVLIGPVKDKIGFRKFSDGENTIILCTKYLNSKSSKVLALLSIGKVEKGTLVAMGNCRLNGVSNNYIVALIEPPKGAFAKKIIRAWQVELQSGRFLAISKAGIDCVNLEDDN